MGLDMYLKRKIYVGNKWRKPEQQIKVVLPEKDEERTFPITKINNAKISEIVEEAGYWRKANQIHNWFIENLEDFEDNGKETWVSKEQLKELLDTVNKVLEASKLVKGRVKNGQVMKDGKMVDNMEDGEFIENPTVAKKLLPTTEGFFFGSTDYDQWYYKDLVNTKQILEEALTYDEGDFYYRASW